MIQQNYIVYYHNHKEDFWSKTKLILKQKLMKIKINITKQTTQIFDQI